MITTTCDENSTQPLVIVVHASVGSGHRSAAQAISQALEDLCGKHPNLPADTEIAVLDILDYGYVKFDGDKTANVTVVFNSLYDFTWHHVFTGRLLWAGGWGWSPCMFKRFSKLVEKRQANCYYCNTYRGGKCCSCSTHGNASGFSYGLRSD